MKKILTLLVLLVSLQVTYAQSDFNSEVATVSDATKKVEKALEKSENPKKAEKPKTWIALGESFYKLYDAYVSNLSYNTPKMQADLFLKEKPIETSNENYNGQVLTKQVYQERVVYFNNGQAVVCVKYLNPSYPNALVRAAEAYEKAYNLDPESSSNKKNVKEGLDAISRRFTDQAYFEYSIENYKEASLNFEHLAELQAMAPINKLDTNALYNAAFTAMLAKDYQRALPFLRKCYENGYYGTDGDVFIRLSEIDKDNAKKYLEEGFIKNPQSQPILIALINTYIANNEDPAKLISLLAKAKENDPKNASLFYVEGNIYSKIGDTEKAVKAYETCAQIDPAYVYGYIGEGIMYYNEAIKLQELAQNELDDAKYAKLSKDFEETLKKCIPPFEKAYNLTSDQSLKVNIAEYLKNAYYRFRDESTQMGENYKKYEKVVADSKK